ncbi:hypothetical protein L3Q82_002881 [Scortum barcoo]|uniref:Uncharacterized protein n=1 Tax=Scortum barcoo TaxID=214431 RepID=A0ACB8VXV7_9TELE|nr:hypothetical protein L3Q82_002881 [Scortum barcoo]
MFEFFWVANEHTFNATDPTVAVHTPIPVEEADSAGEVLAWCKPLTKRDPEPAGDAEMFSIPQGSVVGRNATCDIFPIDLPEHTHVVRKFSDDSAVVGLITDGDDREYRGLIQDFADWCLRNNLQINAGKTKELVVDFRRRSHSPPAPVSIQGTDIDTVKSYKYLGVHLNDSLDWSDNTDALIKKGNSRLFLAQEAEVFLECRDHSSGPFMTLWWHQPSFMG